MVPGNSSCRAVVIREKAASWSDMLCVDESLTKSHRYPLRLSRSFLWGLRAMKDLPLIMDGVSVQP